MTISPDICLEIRSNKILEVSEQMEVRGKEIGNVSAVHNTFSRIYSYTFSGKVNVSSYCRRQLLVCLYINNMI
jgi:hypothetical protein